MIKRLWRWLTEKEYRIVNIGAFSYEAQYRSRIFPIWLYVPGTLSSSPSDTEIDLRTTIRAKKYKGYLGREDTIMGNNNE